MGTWIVSGSFDKSVCVWDVSTGVKLKELNLTSTVSSILFSCDGTQIVCGSEDNNVWVWDASTGVVLKELKGHTSLVSSVAFQMIPHRLCLVHMIILFGCGTCQQL